MTRPSDYVFGVAHVMRWRPLAISCGLALAIMLVPLAFGARLRVLDATLVLHLALVVLTVGSAYVLDDSATQVTSVAPLGDARLRLTRMLLALVPTSLTWAALLVCAPYLDETGHMPRSGLVMELFSMLAIIWWVASWAARRRADGIAGRLAGPFVVLLVVWLAMLPPGYRLFLNPTEAGFHASRWGWVALLVCGLVGILSLHVHFRFGRKTITNPRTPTTE